MYSCNNNTNFSGRRKRQPRRRGGPNGKNNMVRYQPSIPRSLNSYSGPTRYAPLNDTFTVSLKNQDYFRAGSATTELFQVLGIVEFLGYRPLYALEMYAIYKYCRVMRVDVIAQCLNLGTYPIRFGVGHIAYNDASGLTFDRFIEKPATAHKLISAKGGIDKAVITKTFNSTSMLGSVLDSKYWVDVTQSASATPIDAKEPVLVIGMDGAEGSADTWTGSVNFTLTYHLQWFDLKTPSSS